MVRKNKMFLKILNKLLEFYLKRVRPKLATEVHTEYYFEEDVWERIKNYPRRDKVVWYIITPANYEYIKYVLGTEMDKETLEKVMSDRIRYMRGKGYKLELHIHFWQNKSMPTEMKRKMIKEAIEWGKNNGITFTKLVPGWVRIDKDLPSLCQEFGLELEDSINFTHDFEL